MADLPIPAPIFVDAVVDVAEPRLVRCNYLAIEADDPMPGWALRLDGTNSLPFFMLGLSGIIVSPPGKRQFSSGGDVDATINLLESHGFTVEASDLWLPHFLFKKQSFDLVPGLVFRVNGALFAFAFRYRDGQVSWEEFAGFCRETEVPRFSREESAAFKDWHQRVRANVQEQQFQRRDRMLKPLI